MSLNIEIGGVSFSLTCDAPLDIRPIASLYAGFHAESAGGWHVRVRLDVTLDDDMPARIRHDGAVTYFRTMSHDGWVDLAKKRAEVSAPCQERVHSGLARVLSFVLMQELPRLNEGMLVHGAGVFFNGEGHLFFGASGRGKSTIARLAHGLGRVISDETVLIRKAADSVRLLSTPFWGLSTPESDIQEVGRAEAPLMAVYALEQSADFRLERLSKAQAAMALLSSEKVATERNESAAAWLAIVDEIASRVPFFRLGFRPTPEVWSFLEQVGCLAVGRALA